MGSNPTGPASALPSITFINPLFKPRSGGENLNRKAAAILGLIGGILVTASIFATWYTSPLGDTSGWDLTKDPSDMVAPYLLLGAGIIIILTCLVLLVKPQEIVEALMGTFSVLAGASAAGVILNESQGADLGYGTYVLLIGAILALIAMLVKKPEK